MRILEDVESLPDPGGPAFCVLASSADAELAQRIAERLGIDTGHGPRSLRRPAVIATDEVVDLMVLALREDRQLSPVRISVTRGGVLVVAADDLLPRFREILADAPEAPWSAVTALLTDLAHTAQDVLEEMVEASERLEEGSHGLSSAPQRREMARLRDQLFEIYEIQEAQSRLLAPEEDLAQGLTERQRHQLKRAAHGFDTARSMAMQLYARLGDVLAQQGTVISERLTVIATVILPLTLVTGFFGMNFGWMTDRLMSLPAFLVLGLAVPVVLVLLTVALTRYIARSS